MEKVDYKHGTFVLVDTDPLQFEYESYEEFCEGNDIEPQGEDSTGFLLWCYEEAEEQYNNDMTEIRCCKEYNVPCIITGGLGLWDGHHDIIPTKADSVYDAIEKCCGRDGHLKVNFEDGAIVAYFSHHDGTNVFTIRALTESGIKKYEDYEYGDAELNLTEGDTARLPYIYAIGIE